MEFILYGFSPSVHLRASLACRVDIKNNYSSKIPMKSLLPILNLPSQLLSMICVSWIKCGVQMRKEKDVDDEGNSVKVDCFD